jgi:hypothetical protein
MKNRKEAVNRFINDLRRLSSAGILGFYNGCEVTEIFAVQPDRKIVNVFSIFVLEERDYSRADDSCIFD